MMRRSATLIAAILFSSVAAAAESGAKVVQTPYGDPRAVYDFYFDRPEKIGPALFWIRSLINPLTETPYDISPELMEIVVIIHGTEIVTVARKNYEKYSDVVERMRYYASLGVRFRVCGLAARDYGYTPEDFYEFIEVAPSALTELVYWQQKGFALITPQVMEKRVNIEDIR